MDILFENRYYTTRKMMVEFGRKYAVGPKKWIMVVTWMLYFFAAIPIFLVPQDFEDSSRTLLVILGVAMLIASFLPEWYARSVMSNAKKQNDGVAPEVVVTFGETIKLHEGMVDVTLEYRKIQKVVRLKYSYILMIGKRNGLMLEPNHFTKGTFAEFKQFLREKCPDLTIPE